VFYIEKIFYAKSNPLETIQTHTDNLLENYYILKKLYPKVSVNWELLRLSCIIHDLGKINEKFQKKITKRIKDIKEIAHNLLSLAFIDSKQLKEEGYSVNDIKLLAQAVAYHHDRGEYDLESYKEEIELLKETVKDFHYDKFKITKIKVLSTRYFSNDRIYEDEKEFYDFVMLKGLLNRLDYAASGYIDVEKENDFLEEAMELLMNKWQEKNKEAKWNELQEFMKNNKENNTIAIAQTGMGKTEAGLLWIGNNKGFFTLPLKTAINEIYKRITKDIVDSKSLVGLLHSDTLSKYINEDEKGEKNQEEIKEIFEYYKQTRQLSLPLTICTLDQIFDFVYRYRDFEPKLATLSYSKVVIDEVQMYSPNLIAYLVLGLKHISNVGGKFSILTATFPSFIEDLLKKQKIEFVKSKKAFIDNKIRHSVKVIKEQLNINEIVENYDNNKILVVCNTVKKAQEIYAELSKAFEEKGVNINLLHSKFIKQHRAKKEKAIMELGNIENKESGIWIGTQVVEASLDIDFDLLFTELSDINGLFQRFGRCYRKREFLKDGYNCFVYTGGTSPCSGIRNSTKSIIDYDIFSLSREALEGIDGEISESQKLELIDKIYSTEKLKNTEYYKKILTTMDYLNSINAYELSKKEVKKIFRDINSVSVIPKPIYDKFYDEINKLEQEINRKVEENEDYNQRKIERYKLIDKLKSYSASISWGEANKRLEDKIINIGSFEQLLVLDCDYTEDVGIILKKEKVGKDLDFDSRVF
jgi:CRISPR-associated endonuclease/helicase Cas3